MSEAGERRQTRVSEPTRQADRQDARVTGHADRPPTVEDAAAAPDHVDPDVAESFEAANERGAKTKGEGRIGV
jgi:hypothetical protein